MEKEQFKISKNTYSILICDIEPNGDIQLQIDHEEWEHPALTIELPGNRDIQLIDQYFAQSGELYAYWGENGRLYLSGMGFKASEVLHRKIGQRIIVKSFEK